MTDKQFNDIVSRYKIGDEDRLLLAAVLRSERDLSDSLDEAQQQLAHVEQERDRHLVELQRLQSARCKHNRRKARRLAKRIAAELLAERTVA